MLWLLQVIFAADEKRDTDAIYAAGWNCKVGKGAGQGKQPDAHNSTVTIT